MMFNKITTFAVATTFCFAAVLAPFYPKKDLKNQAEGLQNQNLKKYKNELNFSFFKK